MNNHCSADDAPTMDRKNTQNNTNVIIQKNSIIQDQSILNNELIISEINTLCPINSNDQEINVDDWINIMDQKSDHVDKEIIQFKNNFVRNNDDKTQISKKDEKQKIITDFVNNKIKVENYEKIDDIELLEKAVMLAKNTKFQINKKFDSNNQKNINMIIDILVILKNIIFEIKIRNLQFVKIINKSSEISRNSYKFCQYGHMCRFNYTLNKKCYAHHFVYDLVCQDINDILQYIKMNHEDKKIDQQEIKISINTITYVINHMYDELCNLKKENPENYEKYKDRKYNLNLLDQQINTIIRTNNYTKNNIKNNTKKNKK